MLVESLIDVDISSRVGYEMGGKHFPENHPDLIKRFKRTDGRLQNAIKMIVSGCCADFTQQWQAAERFIDDIKKLPIHDCQHHCPDEIARTPQDFKMIIADFKDITKDL